MQSIKRCELTREELFEKVWETPMSRLAPTFGLSDVGLRNICKKHNIPTPPIGHWARLQFGKKVNIPKLPKMKDDVRIIITPHSDPLPDYTELDDPLIQKVASHLKREQEEFGQIDVPETVASPVRIVARTAANLRKRKPDDKGLVSPHGY